MIEEYDRAAVHVNFGRVPADGRAGTRIDVDVFEAAFGRRVEEIQAAPVPAARHARETNMRGVIAGREQTAIYGERRACAHEYGRPRSDRECDSGLLDDIASDMEWTTGSFPGGASRN